MRTALVYSLVCRKEIIICFVLFWDIRRHLSFPPSPTPYLHPVATPCDYDQIYLKAMTKVIRVGPEYVSTEIKRLGEMISSPAVSHSKKTMFLLRRNVLRSFQFDGGAGGVGGATT